MEFMLDTANIADIKKFEKIIPLAGVTSNPSIVKNEGNIEFFSHMKQIIGDDKSLHVQVVATDYEGMLKDAETILAKIDKNVFVKVPVSEEGLKVIKETRSECDCNRNLHQIPSVFSHRSRCGLHCALFQPNGKLKH